MSENNNISDFITFPKTFENYKWYKPIAVFILFFIIMAILSGIFLGLLNLMFGIELLSIFRGGTEILNTSVGILISDLIIVLIIPSLYLASKIVKDRPFSSYSSSRGGWNLKLYFKALIIPLVLYLIFEGIETAIYGSNTEFQFSIPFLLIVFIVIPLQSIAEEYIFRGFLMQTLGSWFNIPVLVVILQAAIFALVHGYNSFETLEIFISGLFWGFFTWKTNGIEISSAMHTANNVSLGIFVMLGLRSTTNALLSHISTAVFLVILGIIMYYVGKKTDWFGELPENS